MSVGSCGCGFDIGCLDACATIKHYHILHVIFLDDCCFLTRCIEWFGTARQVKEQQRSMDGLAWLQKCTCSFVNHQLL